MLSSEMGDDERRKLAAEIIAANGALDTIASRRGMPRHTIASVARSYGWPDLDLMRERVQTPTLNELVARAQALDLARPLAAFRVAVRALTQEVEAGEAILAARRRAEEARAAKLAEVEQMRARLEKAQRELAEMDAPPPVDARAIREWARLTGVECPAKGRIPETVRAAYEEAHRD